MQLGQLLSSVDSKCVMINGIICSHDAGRIFNMFLLVHSKYYLLVQTQPITIRCLFAKIWTILSLLEEIHEKHNLLPLTSLKLNISDSQFNPFDPVTIA